SLVTGPFREAGRIKPLVIFLRLWSGMCLVPGRFSRAGLRLGGGMISRATGAMATLLIGIGTSVGDASAQYYPQPQAYPPAYPPTQAYPPYRPLPPIADAD